MIASQIVLIRILIRNELGVLETPASTPTMALFRNGADPSVTVTPSLITTGVYTAGWTNGAWNVGDIIQLQVSSVFGTFTFVDNYNFVIGLSSTSGGLDAAGIRTALGMSAADMDAQLNAILGASGSGGDDAAAIYSYFTSSDREDVFKATGFSTLDASGIRTALGMTAADLDAQLDAILSASGGSGLDAAGVRAALGMTTADMDDQLDAIFAASGDGGLDAAGIRAAIGLATANLDTQLSGLNTAIQNVDATIDLSPILELFPNNFDALFIDNAGRVRTTPATIAFDIGVTTPNVGFDSSGFVYVKELNRTVTFTANTDIEEIDLVLVFENSDRTDVLVVPDEDLTKVGNVVTYVLPESLTQNEGTLIWGIREATDQTVYGFGQIQIVYAPHED